MPFWKFDNLQCQNTPEHWIMEEELKKKKDEERQKQIQPSPEKDDHYPDKGQDKKKKQDRTIVLDI